jgi:predicted house-cleaning noncanonical NTP pyrophosphatase (MazG superfamily)
VEYNKLVRDKIPEVIRESGKKFRYRVATEDEYGEYLKAKLLEEAQEFFEDPCEKELADIFEVIDALSRVYKLQGAYAAQICKRIDRGGFDMGFILEWVED